MEESLSGGRWARSARTLTPRIWDDRVWRTPPTAQPRRSAGPPSLCNLMRVSTCSQAGLWPAQKAPL